MTKIIVLFVKTSDYKFREVKQFESYEALFRWMMEAYHRWVLMWLDKSCDVDRIDIEFIEKEISRKLKDDEMVLRCEMYDDWRE